MESQLAHAQKSQLCVGATLNTLTIRIYCLHNLADFVTLCDTKNVTFPPGLDYSDDPFYNHVFLEHHLEPWCPRSGPIRQFMETVCLGLS